MRNSVKEYLVREKYGRFENTSIEALVGGVLTKVLTDNNLNDLLFSKQELKQRITLSLNTVHVIANSLTPEIKLMIDRDREYTNASKFDALHTSCLLTIESSIMKDTQLSAIKNIPELYFKIAQWLLNEVLLGVTIVWPQALDRYYKVLHLPLTDGLIAKAYSDLILDEKVYSELEYYRIQLAFRKTMRVPMNWYLSNKTYVDVYAY